jgi:hypothetical protein
MVSAAISRVAMTSPGDEREDPQLLDHGCARRCSRPLPTRRGAPACKSAHGSWRPPQAQLALDRGKFERVYSRAAGCRLGDVAAHVAWIARPGHRPRAGRYAPVGHDCLGRCRSPPVPTAPSRSKLSKVFDPPLQWPCRPPCASGSRSARRRVVLRRALPIVERVPGGEPGSLTPW